MKLTTMAVYGEFIQFHRLDTHFDPLIFLIFRPKNCSQKQNFVGPTIFWKRLFSKTLPANKNLFARTLWQIRTYLPELFHKIRTYLPEPLQQAYSILLISWMVGLLVCLNTNFKTNYLCLNDQLYNCLIHFSSCIIVMHYALSIMHHAS